MGHTRSEAVVGGKEVREEEPDYDTFEDWMIHYLKVIATEMTKIRKEINHANKKEQKCQYHKE